MKRKCLHFALMSVLVFLIVSCSNNDDPVTPPQYRISRICSDNLLQLFEYDASGRISEWKYEDLTQDRSDTYNSTYRYSGEEGVIEINSTEQRGDETWSFNERLYLNQDGTASHATGNVTILGNGEWLLMKKNYLVSFHYNSSHQLTKIDVEEKRTNDTGWEESGGLQWFIEMEWDENNLITYSEYSNRDYPMFSKTFTYYEGDTAHYIPIMQGPILRHYYLPLQYQGLFGPQSVGLVKEASFSSNFLNHSTTFSYDLSVSVYNSVVEKYSEFVRGAEVECTITWDRK